jgi:hypothetical protein
MTVWFSKRDPGHTDPIPLARRNFVMRTAASCSAMESRLSLVSLLALVLSSSLHAAEGPTVTRESTGILAGGSFYSVYTVQCPDDTRTAIVSLNRRTKWCAQEGSGVACLRDYKEAALRACQSGREVVARLDVGDLAGNAQN